ncbi:SRPBCC family protein [Paracoccus laeviglucosivorans]|uniref:Polyketide cyclase / dehydrase and lipid transport n=1 Tax=Paracoccus laeviglucosivorans TaxID=1197861 RepID=A0A521BZX1_9RHOB|nr:SRPBCC family protein [Paracoccus laeviglucosivorans]SMO52645.1 hypothetical protein SAMN06265221_103283 [Paracoccus laeviglucosivorans]
MKFSTRQDTDLAADALFRAVSDFPRLERILLRRGATVRRVDGNPQPGRGNAWQIGFDWRGKQRDLSLKVATFNPPQQLTFAGQSEQFNIDVQITVVALTPTKSRLIFEVDVQPRGMKARLMLQTAKLGKAQLDRKFSQRIGEFVDRLAAEQYT